MNVAPAERYMKLLEDRIKKDGRLINSDILKVDSFLNHQIDVGLMDAMGEEFARCFSGLGVNKIVTIESSGIPLACAAARAMGGLPVVFAKKAVPNTMTEEFYSATVRSFTKNKVYEAIVSKRFLSEDDVCLIIDDFLASGEAAEGLVKIIEQAGARCAGVGAAIEKEFQGGSAKLRERGLKVVSLAVITSLADDRIQFKSTYEC